MEFVLKQIRAQREMRNVSLDQLSSLTGLSAKYLEDLEDGQVDPPLSCLVKITSALNVTVKIGNITI